MVLWPDSCAGSYAGGPGASVEPEGERFYRVRAGIRRQGTGVSLRQGWEFAGEVSVRTREETCEREHADVSRVMQGVGTHVA